MNNNGYIDPQDVINALDTIKREWTEAADGLPLEEVQGSVGLLLDDVRRGILKQEEITTAAD